MKRCNRCILGAVAATILAGCSASDSSVPDDGSGLSDPQVVAELRDLALRASSSAGVPSPKTMVAVAASDHQAAEMVLSGAIIPDHAPVYVIEMTGGTFTARSAPPGGAALRSHVLTVTVDAATFRITDVGYVDEAPDLDEIGSVTVDLLHS
jgi:hypothetical protein